MTRRPREKPIEISEAADRLDIGWHRAAVLRDAAASPVDEPAASPSTAPEVYHSRNGLAVYVRFPGRPGWATVVPADVVTAAGIDTAGLIRYTPDPPPTRKGYNGTGVPCRPADLEGRVGERLEIAVYDNVTAGKTSTVTGVLDSVDDLTAMVSPLWSPWQVSINVHDIANVWTAEPR